MNVSMELDTLYGKTRDLISDIVSATGTIQNDHVDLQFSDQQGIALFKKAAAAIHDHAILEITGEILSNSKSFQELLSFLKQCKVHIQTVEVRDATIDATAHKMLSGVLGNKFSGFNCNVTVKSMSSALQSKEMVFSS